MRSSLKMTSVAGATLALAAALAFAPSLPARAQYATGTDGASPIAQLTLGSDGFFYSVTPLGGAYGEGTLFRFDRTATATPSSCTTSLASTVTAPTPPGP